jgi:hypothetical protein
MLENDDFLYLASSARPYFSRDGESYLAETPLRALRKTQKLRVLSEDDFAFWQKYGYVVVRQAVPADDARRLLDFAWDFQGLDPVRPETWYPERDFASDLERDLYIWDCDELWVSLDRLNLNPPNVGNRDRALIPATERGFDIDLHWDVDTTLDVLPQRVQGIIALTDSRPELGGFQCSPELFHQFDRWRIAQPAGRDPIRPNTDRSEFPVISPELHPGDLLIWNGLLAHGVLPNRSADAVRAVQYLTMMPALPTHERLVSSRVRSWRELRTPEWNATLTGDPIRHESERYAAPELSTLGRRLLGVEPWPAAGAA